MRPSIHSTSSSLDLPRKTRYTMGANFPKNIRTSFSTLHVNLLFWFACSIPKFACWEILIKFFVFWKCILRFFNMNLFPEKMTIKNNDQSYCTIYEYSLYIGFIYILRNYKLKTSIVIHNIRTNITIYKQNRCTNSYSENKNFCWRFFATKVAACQFWKPINNHKQFRQCYFKILKILLFK